MGHITIVKASAGSGKTYRLAYEYIRRVIANPSLYRHILAVTFTNKATEEMKRRIVGELNALASREDSEYLPKLEADLQLAPETIRQRAISARSKILHDYSHFTVLTIDKFFQRIIRSFIKELGLDLNFNLELQTDSLLEGAADRLIDEISLNARLRDWVMRFVEEKIERGKTWNVRDEIIELGQELFSERYKNRHTPIHSREELARIASEVFKGSQAILGRLKKIAREALQTARDGGLSVSDFAYGNSGPMGYVQKIEEGRIEPYKQRVKDALSTPEKWYSKSSPKAAQIRALIPRLQPLLQQLCETYDQNIRFLKTAALVQENYRSYALLEDLSQKVDALCTEGNILPISETNTLLGQLIAGNDTPFIYEKVGNAFSEFMIDEFQDTSVQQWENFVPLLDNALAQSEESPVLLVGDVKQSIYRWRGGDWRILGEEVSRRFSRIREERLEANYRSEGTIVRFNNALIDRCVETDNRLLNDFLLQARVRELISADTLHHLTDMLQRAYDGQAQQPKRSLDAGYVRITLLARSAAESEAGKSPIIAQVEELQERGFAPEEIAILVRRKSEGVALAGELLDYKAAHPESPYCYDLVTQEALTIGNAPVCRFIAAVFALSVDAQESIHRALYNQFRGLPLERALDEGEERFVASLRLRSLEEAFDEVLLQYGLHERTEEIAYLQALQDQIHTFSTSKIADIPLFLKWWQETGREQSISLPEKSRALTILTIHKSKGLEYKAVIIPYCDWDLMPPTNRALIWAQGSQEPFSKLGEIPLRWKNEIGESYFSEAYFREAVLSHIDNLNTFYVAATRAREELYVFLHGEAPVSTINGLIRSVLPASKDSEIHWGDLSGKCFQDDRQTVYTFGTPCRKVRQPMVPFPSLSFPVRRDESKLKLHFDSERYFSDEETSTLDPRHYGTLMHKLFEQIDDHTQIGPTLERWRSNGLLSDEEADSLEHHIAQVLENPLIRSWFDPRWDTVRNEHDIIVPGSSSVRRPDRVLTQGTEAVVIDYKFGYQEKKGYEKQVQEYLSLLRRMGYRKVKGYLWYVQKGEVREVPAQG